MSWHPIQPPAAVMKEADATVFIGGRNQDRLVLSLNTAALPKSWRGG